MAEYIEREEAVHLLMTRGRYLTKDLVMDAAYEVSKIPAADVAPVRHGRWEDVYGGKYQNKRYRCTVCKEKALFKFYQDELLTWHEEQKLSNYYPNCGAKMDLEEDNT